MESPFSYDESQMEINSDLSLLEMETLLKNHPDLGVNANEYQLVIFYLFFNIVKDGNNNIPVTPIYDHRSNINQNIPSLGEKYIVTLPTLAIIEPRGDNNNLFMSICIEIYNVIKYVLNANSSNPESLFLLFARIVSPPPPQYLQQYQQYCKNTYSNNHHGKNDNLNLYFIRK